MIFNLKTIKILFSCQLIHRPSARVLLSTIQPLLQEEEPASLPQLLSILSNLFCGYPEGGGSRIISLNWYEDNNYKAFLGIDAQEKESVYFYDNSTSKSPIWIMTSCEIDGLA